MNILPKKRWHVRTKENIARVRRDEAEAAENERQEKLRVENADREARLNFLKQKSKQNLLEHGVIAEIRETHEHIEVPGEHINLFADIDGAIKTKNKEHEIEARLKKEEYEKQIGYLTYLGQDTNEALGKKNWYEVAPGHSRLEHGNRIKETYNKLVLKDEEGKPKPRELDIKNGELGWKSKQRDDPIYKFKKYLNKEKPKNNSSISEGDKQKNNCISSKKEKEDKKDKLQKLREARLKREQQEKYRTELFLKKLHNPINADTKIQKETEVKQKYNSQFNPDLARQNFR
ncbi:leukocyte receptor cluster member 1 homolog [Manduca sexta]|uniref:CBF1-interacting co-repressor CIR N-terminal domain-containing protein n=1 Tax=Manduca sexta TaxID=7130 RepID=A0A922CGA8_MANSE|nr:leukocyte receptor cluster member 1 homolog [Manduca sexta]KAG6444859.1 hypothetical protein O3G_MSEX003509 [Manduca sexta]